MILDLHAIESAYFASRRSDETASIEASTSLGPRVTNFVAYKEIDTAIRTGLSLDPITRTMSEGHPRDAGAPSPGLAEVGERLEASEHISVARDQRLAFLARKYDVGMLVPEESARLEILTARLRRLAPHASTNEVVALEQITDRLEATRSDVDRIRRELGLEP